MITTEVITQGHSFPYFGLLLFAIGITAITFIAIILFLDIRAKDEPLSLPEKVI